MLSQIAGYDDQELIKQVQIGDLSMGTTDISIDDLDQATVSQLADGTPVSRFTTAWFLTNLGCFRVDFSIIGPKTEEPKQRLTLTKCEAQGRLKAITHQVKFLKKKLR